MPKVERPTSSGNPTAISASRRREFDRRVTGEEAKHRGHINGERKGSDLESDPAPPLPASALSPPASALSQYAVRPADSLCSGGVGRFGASGAMMKYAATQSSTAETQNMLLRKSRGCRRALPECTSRGRSEEPSLGSLLKNILMTPSLRLWPCSFGRAEAAAHRSGWSLR